MWTFEPFGGSASLARAVAARFVALLVLTGCDADVVSIGAAPAAASSSDAASDAPRDVSSEAASDAPDETSPDAPGDVLDDGVVRVDGGKGIYLEAEDGVLSGGFTIGDDVTASGGQFIAPPVGINSGTQAGTARAVYNVDITTSGSYLIWGRIHSPDANHNRVWVQVDGGSWYVWRITTGDIWYWNFLHDNTNYYTPLVFDFAAGRHELVVANAIDNVGVDRWYFALPGDRPPQTDTPCRPPDSIPVSGVCIPSCGSLGGATCGTTFCAGRTPTEHVYDCVVCCY